MHTVNVDLKERSYPIYIGVHILERFASYFKKHLSGKKVFIVTNEKISGLYLEPVLDSFKDTDYKVDTITIQDGEEYKNQETVNAIYDELLSHKCERSSTIVALGGGIVGDVAGYAAATVLRGINFVQIPTTLLAHTDASVGGKVGINHRLGKNMIGAFYQPKFVFIDVDTLKTLEKREFIAGLAEVVKHGIIRDEELFTFLEEHIDDILKLELNTMVHIVESNCQIKADVVREDEKEHGLRSILNYGHTFAHAIETITDYKTYKHGEAVMKGMIIAGKVARELSMLSKEDFDRQNRLIIKLFNPRTDPKITVKKMLAAMQQDKKVRDGRIRLVLARQIGKVELVTDVPPDILTASIDWFLSTSKHPEKK